MNSQEIHTERRGDSWIVSVSGTWLPGRYESQAGAIQAERLEPAKLHEMHAKSLAQGREGLILDNDLTA